MIESELAQASGLEADNGDNGIMGVLPNPAASFAQFSIAALSPWTTAVQRLNISIMPDLLSKELREDKLDP